MPTKTTPTPEPVPAGPESPDALLAAHRIHTLAHLVRSQLGMPVLHHGPAVPHGGPMAHGPWMPMASPTPFVPPMMMTAPYPTGPYPLGTPFVQDPRATPWPEVLGAMPGQPVPLAGPAR